MGWVIREVSFPWNALDEKGAYRAYATDERRSRSRPSTEKGPAKRLTHFSDGLLDLPDRGAEATDPSHMWDTSQNAVRRLKTRPATVTLNPVQSPWSLT
ncbi:MAG: hypothetical protein KTR25_17385 [Myxococcales bacterium]|nr:hypothetical protein [Myxococcales bacterium]